MAMVLKYPTNSPEINGRATIKCFLAKVGSKGLFPGPWDEDLAPQMAAAR